MEHKVSSCSTLDETLRVMLLLKQCLTLSRPIARQVGFCDDLPERSNKKNGARRPEAQLVDLEKIWICRPLSLRLQ